MRTRRTEDELGVIVEVAGTRVFKQEAVQCGVGTSFQVKNLFFNVPARRRFLKSDNVEKSHILNEFYRIALVNPEIAFSFFDGDDEVYQLPTGNFKVRIENIFGKNGKKRIQQQLLPIETSTNLVRIQGFVGKPEFAQKSANQYFFVNGRYMRHPYFHKAVILAYNQMIQSTESPNYFIYFEVEPDTIDVNIHPTKTEIKFENEQAIWSIISATVKESLGKFNVLPSIDFDQEGALDMPVQVNIQNVRPPQTNFNPNYNPFGNTGYKRPELDWEKLYGGFENQPSETPMVENWDSNTDVPTVTTFSYEQQQKVIENLESKTENFQYKNRYILTGIKSGLLMIEQHRAHVRILFDLFLSQIVQMQAVSQQVLFPETLELSADEDLFFEQIIDDLRHVGFGFEKSVNHSYLVNGVPSHIGTISVVDLLYDIVEKAQTTALEAASGIQDSIAMTLAEASALKTGQRMTNEEMSDLIDRLFACSNPNYTPDGKKITNVWSQEDIDSAFR